MIFSGSHPPQTHAKKKPHKKKIFLRATFLTKILRNHIIAKDTNHHLKGNPPKNNIVKTGIINFTRSVQSSKKTLTI